MFVSVDGLVELVVGYVRFGELGICGSESTLSNLTFLLLCVMLKIGA